MRLNEARGHEEQGDKGVAAGTENEVMGSSQMGLVELEPAVGLIL